MSERPRRAVGAERSYPALVVEFVGTADTCRSVFCRLLATSMADSQLAVFGSSGLLSRRGDSVEPQMAALLGRVGVDAGRAHSRPLDERILRGADLVLTMDALQHDFVTSCWPDHQAKVFGLGQFVSRLDSLASSGAGLELVRAMPPGEGRADPSFDVPDPHGWGKPAAQEVARQLGTMTTSLLRTLGLLAVPGPSSQPRRSSG